MNRCLPLRVFMALLLVSVLSSGAWAQSSSASASSSVSGSGPAEASIGGLVFEVGSRLAVEVIREESIDCFPSVLIQSLTLLQDDETLLHEEILEPAIEAGSWLGRLPLSSASGEPLPAGQYRIVVTTGVGTFTAQIEAADRPILASFGRYSASASVCGLALRVYRLVDETDHDARIALRVGDRLMVALEGNPTTGYEWANTLAYEYAVLRESEEVEYRADDSELVGSGGTFLFRYEAIASGPQAFRFACQRPWESVEPLELLEFTADVY